MNTACLICPRECGADRKNGETGYCGCPDDILIARAARHFGEEPCISGTRGSGTVFFSGCNLRCVFCQNHEISSGHGLAVSPQRLSEIFLELQDEGVHNINLVTPSHYALQIAEVLEKTKLSVPVVWNSSGYESVETLRRLDGLVQIYMPDYKYALSRPAAEYSFAPDYPEKALAAIKEMFAQRGRFVMDDDGIMKSGVLIRHLVLPGETENTLRVIDAIEDNLPAKEIVFSLMSQYTPMPGVPEKLSRGISAEEYARCASYLDFSDIEYGYCQSPESCGEEMIPDFDGTGV